MHVSGGSLTMTMMSMSFKFSPIPSPASPSSRLPYLYYITRQIKFPTATVQTKTLSPDRFHFRRLVVSPSQSPEPSPDTGTELSVESAQKALSEFLSQEFGLSEDESTAIVSRAPKYVGSLVEGVAELEELSRWDSDYKETAGGFKEKIVFLAKQKGHDGKVAFLESLGLSLPSAVYIARFLSAVSLLGLINKVKTMKEMFFPSGGVGLIDKKARKMMSNLSIHVDDDVQKTLSFFEKIGAKRGGLNILDNNDASFGLLIESFPRVLLLSVESHLKPLMEFLESLGIPRENMRNILLLFPPIILSDVEDLKRKILVFEKVVAAEGSFGKLLIKYPWIVSSSIQQNHKIIVSFLETEKVPRLYIDRAIKSMPLLLGCSTRKLEAMLEFFDELGIRYKKLGKVIAKSPQLLLRPPHEILEVVIFLEGVGFDRDTVGKILVRCPEIFAASVEKTLKRKIEFLTTIGIRKERIPRVIKKYPELLVCDVKQSLLPRMNYLRRIGLSKKDIAYMVWTFSPLLGYSIEKVYRPKVEFLVMKMERPLREVVNFPRYFSYSLEEKIKPRYWVLKGRKVECSLKEMLGKNDEEFAAMLLPPPPPPGPSDSVQQ